MELIHAAAFLIAWTVLSVPVAMVAGRIASGK